MVTTQRFRINEPADGFWATLSTRTADHGTGDIYRSLERHLQRTRTLSKVKLSELLTERTDPTRYRPQAIPDVAEEQLTEGDQTYTVICSPRGQYLRLTPIQRDLWHSMDGKQTVAQLAMEVFVTHKQLVPVGEFVALLKQEGFLVERSTNLYQKLSDGLEQRTAEGWGRRLLRGLATTTYTIPQLDSIYGTIYRYAGRWLFTLVFLAVWVLVVLAGLTAFAGLFLGGYTSAYSVLSIGDSVPLGLATLWVALFVSFILHESAHALAVKHFRRTIHGGGVMLYYGMPAAFIDTSDIWRSPRQARILVSAAGPMSDLLIGSLAALAALALANDGTALALSLGALCFKLAVTSYVTVLFNANPLLELDGYFILVDLLRLPNLRQRALAFVRGPLWTKLFSRTRAGQETTFSREERIMALYGVLTTLYTIFAVIAAAIFWQEQLQPPIFALLGPERAWWEQLIGWALLLLVVVPILAALALAGLGLVRASVGWAVRRGYGRQPALLAGLSLILVTLLALATRQPDAWYAGWVAPVLWLIALGALLALQPDYRGAAISPALGAMLLTTASSAVAAIIRTMEGDAAVNALVWVTPEAIAFVFLLLAGFGALLDVELRFVPLRELLATVALLIMAFVAGGIALILAEQRWPLEARTIHIIASAPAYFGALAVALMLPRLFDLRDSRLVWAWVMLWFATVIETFAYLANLQRSNPLLDTLAAGLWAVAWLMHLTIIRQVTAFDLRWEHVASLTEAQRLARAFQYTYAGCYRLLRTTYGERRAKAFDDRMDVIAATADWNVTLDRDRARISDEVRQLPLDEQGSRYAEVLRYTILMIEEIAGAVFARRAIQAAYDALPWPERETAGRLCFPDTPWARDLSSSFGDTRDGRLRLLRQVELFITCDDAELEELSHTLQEQQIGAETILLRAGTPTTGVWIIEAGEVIVKHQGQIVAELHRGDTFGASELIADRPADRTYRTSVTSTLLFIPAEAYAMLMESRAPHTAEALDAIEIVRLMERVPLFATIPRHTLRELAHHVRREQVPERKIVIRQGQASGIFYIIQAGQVAIITRDQDADGKPQLRQVARLGNKEFFGELELLRGNAPVASVITITPTTLLAIPHAAIRTLVLRDGSAARNLEQVGSGRMLSLRER